MHMAIDDNGGDLVRVLQKLDVLDGVAVDEDHVGVVAGLDLAQFVRVAHDLAAEACRREQGFFGRVAEQVDEVGEVSGFMGTRKVSSV